MQSRHYGVWPKGLPHSLPPSEFSVFQNLLGSAGKYPETLAVSYYGKGLRYKDLLHEVRSVAGFLHRKFGVQRKDRVALYMQNAPQFIIAYYAILAANAVIVPINPMFKRAELAHILRDSGATALIHGEELSIEVAAVKDEFRGLDMLSTSYGEYAPAEADLGIPGNPLQSPAPDRALSWTDALALNCQPPEHICGPDDWCIIPYSSGTSGRPKGCLHTHSSVNATIYAYPGWVGIEDGSRILATLPFCHVTGMQHSMNLPILTGSTIYLMTRWNAETAANIIETERIQHWRSITTMMIDFLSLPGIEHRDLSSLQAIGGGGAQMPKGVAQKMEDLIGLDYIEAYGLTETMAPTHINPVQAPRKQCLGIPIFDVDCRVIDPETNDELGASQTGEIVTHAPQVFQGYWQRPEETAAAFIEIDGKKFFRTGDIGYYDEQGYFYFVDRLKRMINVSGLKVWPAEVEAILHGHPDIAEACVVADEDPRSGEAARAVIVPAKGSATLEVEALRAWCKENMAAYKVPRHFEFRSELPRGAAGKVLWKDL